MLSNVVHLERLQREKDDIWQREISMVIFKFGKIFIPLPLIDFIKEIISRDLEKIDTPIYSVKGHQEIINAIDAVGGLGIGEGAPEIATASRDGRINARSPTI